MRRSVTVTLLLAGLPLVAFGRFAAAPATEPDFTWQDPEIAQAGYSIDGTGDLNGDGYADLAVGARFAQKVFVFLGGPDGLFPLPSWIGQGLIYLEYYGSSVSTAGDVNGDGIKDLVVGSPGFFSFGRVHVYLGSQTTPWVPQGNPIVIEGSDYFTQFGYSVASGGDATGDGVDDLLVGAPNEDGGDHSGAAYLYAGGGAMTLGASPMWSYKGESGLQNLGDKVCFAGNVNGDKSGSGKPMADILLSAPSGGAGSAVAFHGSATGPAAVPDWTVQGEGTMPEDSRFGAAIAGAGDLNGDGFGDVLVGSPHFNGPNGNQSGRVYLYRGGAGGLSATPFQKLDGQEAGAGFGRSLSWLRDHDGDGKHDAIVGGYHIGFSAGAVFVLKGNGGGLVMPPLLSLSGGSFLPDMSEEGTFGASVTGAGDFNGDDQGDIMIGAPETTMVDGYWSGALHGYFSFNPGKLVPSNLGQAKVGSLAPIPAGGTTNQPAFVASAKVKGPVGSGGVSLEVEVLPWGTPFGPLPGSTIKSDFHPNGSTVSVDVGGLAIGSFYHWRARCVSGTGYESGWVTFNGDAGPALYVAGNQPPTPAPLDMVDKMVLDKVKPGATVYDSNPLAFQCVIDDPDLDRVRLEVRLTFAGGDTMDLSSPLTASGQVASAEVPPLVAGQSFSIASRAVDEFGAASPWVGGLDGGPAPLKVSAYGSTAQAPGCSASGAAAAWALLPLALAFALRRRA